MTPGVELCVNCTFPGKDNPSIAGLQPLPSPASQLSLLYCIYSYISQTFTGQAPVASPLRSGAPESPRTIGIPVPRESGTEAPPDWGPGSSHHPHTTTAVTYWLGLLNIFSDQSLLGP